MIGKITGKLLEKNPPFLLIDVNGVGYELLATMNTIYQLPECMHDVSVFTHLIVREDAHTLFGFSDKQERQLFRTLIKVNGVGPKLALSILSGIEPQVFASCVNNNDIASLTRIPGVGKKTAERLLIEMRDRLSDWELTDTTANTANLHTSEDAISALVALGYKQKDAEKAVKNVYNSEHTSELLIRNALRAMMV